MRGSRADWSSTRDDVRLFGREFPADRTGGNAGNGRIRWHIVGDNRICSYRGIVADGDSGKDANAPTDPHLLSDVNGASIVAGIAERDPLGSGVVRVANAGVLADHGSLADGDARHGDEMYPARKHDAGTEGDDCRCLSFEMAIGVEQGVRTKLDHAGAEDVLSAQHDDRGGQRGLQVRS